MADFWTTTEDRTLRAVYPLEGPKGCVERLPGRSYSAIVTRAAAAGLKFVGTRTTSKRKHEMTPELERDIRDLYASRPVRGAVGALAEKHGVPGWWLKRQAAKLGVSRPAKKEPPWSDEEDALLRKLHGRAVEYIQKRFAAAGYSRTILAITVRRKRLQLSPRPAEFYTAEEVAKMLGLAGSKSVTYWIHAGWLDASRMRSSRTEAQGGDCHWIHERDLRAFVLENPHLVDLRKIPDAEWFISLVAGRKGDGRQHRRKKPERQEAA